jgi:hypothetical protein
MSVHQHWFIKTKLHSSRQVSILLGTLTLRERDRRLYVWLIGERGARARGRRRGGAVVLCGGG